jgi:hypothetical protein
MYKWDVDKAFDLIRDERCTQFNGAPVMMQQLLGSPRFASTDSDSLYGLGLGGAVATSFMGCAAAPLNGSTLCSLLTLTGDDCARNKPKEKVSQADITTFELLCGCPRTKLTVLFMDELSTVGGIFAGNIDQTLRLIMECTGLAMGGLIVIFAGDFLQKPPSVPKTPWFSSLVSVDAYGAPAPSADSSMVHGLALMRSLRLATFTRQMRTDDAAHQKMLTELRRLDAEPVFSRAVLNSLQFITPHHVARDPGWMFAPIGVISNQERILYNYMQALNTDIEAVAEASALVDHEMAMHKMEQKEQDSIKRKILDDLQTRLQTSSEVSQAAEEENKMLHEHVLQVAKNRSALRSLN